ncbi:db6e9eb7-3782-4db9-9d22-6475528ff2e9 [Sclerotinia trifoliorum]|uniref:Db6e9eb7-3782-4db9-9d22-6475528ff2e9 n=1 Tax=Sclerotinia trifoliorum TaxID=28548 RepID=A0A8H2ZNK2_9HELO|nr:db6e9eb7-3782-4db9-9d22-6475528ff2e9 [Sclerotinia trifoliorum]
MPQVLPGDVTGLYYILVSNLPWSCTWQRLKDFARNQDCTGHFLAVEHAQVYPESTCGWVTVRGKEDFLEALQYLQGGMMENRALCADGRNETESIQVRDLAMPWTTQYSCESPARDPTPPAPMPLVSSAHSGPIQQMSFYQMAPLPSGTSTTTSISTTFDDRGMTQIQQIRSVGIYPNVPLPPTFDPILYAGDVAPSTPMFISPLQTFTTSPPLLPSAEQYDTMSIVKSKVIITQIPHHASTTDLRNLIHAGIKAKFLDTSSAENPLAALCSMKIEKHPDGRQKSHAFLSFETYSMARAIVDMLDGVDFKGRNLRVKLAKEGAEPRQSPIRPISTASASILPLRERGQPKSQVSSQVTIHSKSSILAPQEKNLRKSKEEKDAKDGTTEERDGERATATATATAKESAVATVAIVAADSEREATPKSPMVVNGSGKNA